ncbi:MAG TPA: hypothetical protein VFL98_02380, partial [Candidatus Paceibacterota bacterium]|nr:hypothetical protein [Candidatus Paceibacterota bacterium]
MTASESSLPSPAHYSSIVKVLLAIVVIIIVGTIFFGGYSGLQRLFGVSGAAPQASTAPADLTGAL